jgi:hypothetical protein
LGNYSARIITLSSFAEPGNTYYLLLSQDAGFDPEETNTSLLDLSEGLGLKSDSHIKSVKKVSSNQLEVSIEKNNKISTVKINVNGLKASISNHSHR